MTALTGVRNARDLGGHRAAGGVRVLTGRVWRADALARLTDEDLVTMAGLSLVSVIDLRGMPEVELLGADRLPPGLRLCPLPVYDETLDIYSMMATAAGNGDPSALLRDGRGERIMLDMYRWFATDQRARQQFGAALGMLADPAGLPVLFHCTAGKDRTGWLAALTLTALGVDRETVFADYLRTNEAVAGARQLLTRLGLDVELFAPLIEARASYLEAAFEAAGDIEVYVTDGLGVDIGALRANLLG
ncbi:tyrosine-protein phosphatase [Longispora albida]|uniref:tyrosine-protein phosphatase n=1 Tax=Longispora albida TaxID=203523 RepID=UPI00035C69F5|nr:tyrosine-protein phosphatase [Longispora albida]